MSAVLQCIHKRAVVPYNPFTSRPLAATSGYFDARLKSKDHIRDVDVINNYATVSGDARQRRFSFIRLFIYIHSDSVLLHHRQPIHYMYISYYIKYKLVLCTGIFFSMNVIIQYNFFFFFK